MDERTARSDAQVAPEYLRTAPAPMVKSRRNGRSRLVGLIIVVAVLLGGYLIFPFDHSTQPHGGAGHNRQAGAQSVGAATVGQGDIRVIINALGTVTPISTITVQTQISGQ